MVKCCLSPQCTHHVPTGCMGHCPQWEVLVLFEPFHLGVVWVGSVTNKASVGRRGSHCSGWGCGCKDLSESLGGELISNMPSIQCLLPHSDSLWFNQLLYVLITRNPLGSNIWVCVLFLPSPDSSLFYICHSFVIQPTLTSYHPTWSSTIMSHLIVSISLSMSIIGLWSVCRTCPKHVCI